jgi:hypothetical protein
MRTYAHVHTYTCKLHRMMTWRRRFQWVVVEGTWVHHAEWDQPWTWVRSVNRFKSMDVWVRGV